MILIDTSLWVDFFKGKPSAEFIKEVFFDDTTILHPYIIGELLLGGLPGSKKDLLFSLPQMHVAPASIIYDFVESNSLSGIGWVDASLLYNCLVGDIELLSNDKNLQPCFLAY